MKLANVSSIKILNSISNMSFRIVKFTHTDYLYVSYDNIEFKETGRGCFMGIDSNYILRPINNRKIIIDGIDEI